MGKEFDQTESVRGLDALPTVRKLNSTANDTVRPRRLWIDALCINQEDVQERNEQVGLMNRIYGDADEVLIWLGLPVLVWLNDLAMEVLQAMTSSPKMDAGKWWALIELLKLPYWTRMWIIQEITLAKRLTIHCRLKSVDWAKISYLREVTSGGARAGVTGRGGVLDTIQFSNIINSPAVKLDRYREVWRENTIRLADLLYTYQNSECTDPRDEVYAILDVSGDCNSSEMSADYSKPLFKIYEDTINFYESRVVLDRKSMVNFSQMLQRSFRQEIKHSFNQAGWSTINTGGKL